MKNNKRFVLVTLLLGAILLVAGCGGANNVGSSRQNGDSATTAGGETKQKVYKIGMITDGGGVNDNSYNQYAWEGLKKLQMITGAEVKYLESKTDADHEPNLNQFVQQGFDLIWSLSFTTEEALRNVANANKSFHFGIIDSDLGGDIPDNVVSVTHKEEEGSFLVGVIAGLMTKTNKIGFIGGVDFATINKFEYGFKAGVKTVNPNAEVTSVYTGSFTAPDLGKQAAATMYDQGIDIIYHAAGPTGAGLFNEAKERKAKGEDIWVIGVDSDQSVTFGTDVTLTSMMKYTNEAIFLMSQRFMKGEFNGGTTQALGLAEGAVGIAPTSDVNVPNDILNQVIQYQNKIIAGEIKVPKNKEEFDQF